MDMALVLSPDGSSCDLAVTTGDIATDSTLQTAILLSLLSDRLADPEDIIPDGSGNRRGWHGDPFLPPLPDGTPDRFGSKLWLRARCTATPQNALLIKGDCEQALAWMIADGVATSVTVAVSWASATALNILVTVTSRTIRGTQATTFMPLVLTLTGSAPDLGVQLTSPVDGALLQVGGQSILAP